jgi:hypothetical protein
MLSDEPTANYQSSVYNIDIIEIATNQFVLREKEVIKLLS